MQLAQLEHLLAVAKEAGCGPTTEIIIASDSEGSRYRPLTGLYFECVYIPLSDKEGRMYDLRWTSAQVGMLVSDWQHISSQPRAILLSP